MPHPHIRVLLRIELHELIEELYFGDKHINPRQRLTGVERESHAVPELVNAVCVLNMRLKPANPQAKSQTALDPYAIPKDAQRCSAYLLLLAKRLQKIRGAPHAPSSSAEDMGVDYGRAHIFVTQKLLDCSNIVSGF